MIKLFLKALIPGLKWAAIEIIAIGGLVSLWVAAAWFLGWVLNRIIGIPDPSSYIAFGSVAIVALAIAQIFFASLLVWVVTAWRSAKELARGSK